MAARGKLILNLLLVHRSVHNMVAKYYTFLKPYQNGSTRSSPPGYWVYPEYDVFRPARSLGFQPSISNSPPDLFSWSRVSNLHLALGSVLRGKSYDLSDRLDYQSIILQLPALEHVCILEESDTKAVKVDNEENPHIITMGSLSRVERNFKFKDQGFLGVKPPHVSRARRRRHYSPEVKEVLRWCRSRKVTIVELANTHPRCPVLERQQRLDQRRIRLESILQDIRRRL